MHHASGLVSRHQRGFSLVELSIVLVIIGLIVGGIVAGRALIKSSELQSVIADVTKYKVATSDFKKQYHAIPGDMVDAREYWQPAACDAVGGTCNGNGDGIVDITSNGASKANESYQFWTQLAAAGFISGSYSGISDASTEGPNSVNTPQSKVGNGLWEVGTQTTNQITTNYGGAAVFNITYGNYFHLTSNGGNNNYGLTPALIPEDAWKIDTKADDGMPGTGTIISSHFGTCNSSGSDSDLAGTYTVSDSNVQCTLFFIKQF